MGLLILNSSGDPAELDIRARDLESAIANAVIREWSCGSLVNPTGSDNNPIVT